MISRNRDAGFTLLEMLVVIAVMGLSLLLISGYLRPHSRRLETEAAARQVADAMRDARGLAITRGQRVVLNLPHLPAWLPVSVQAPSSGIIFTPDGGSSGGRVILGLGSQNKTTVSADWLTGHVQINAH